MVYDTCCIVVMHVQNVLFVVYVFACVYLDIYSITWFNHYSAHFIDADSCCRAYDCCGETQQESVMPLHFRRQLVHRGRNTGICRGYLGLVSPRAMRVEYWHL